MHLAAWVGLCALLAAAPAAASDECLACHGQQGLTKSFAGGETLSLHVDGAAFKTSVHAPVGCAACHAQIDLKTHPAKTRDFPTARAYAIAAVEACRGCHETIYDAWVGSTHGKARDKASGLQGPICADCHPPHAVTRASVGTRLKDTCLTCHAGSPEAHDKWLPNSRRHLAVVACAACHAPAAKRKVDLRFYDAAGKNEMVGGHGELQPGKPLDEKGARRAHAGRKQRRQGQADGPRRSHERRPGARHGRQRPGAQGMHHLPPQGRGGVPERDRLDRRPGRQAGALRSATRKC